MSIYFLINSLDNKFFYFKSFTEVLSFIYGCKETVDDLEAVLIEIQMSESKKTLKVTEQRSASYSEWISGYFKVFKKNSHDEIFEKKDSEIYEEFLTDCYDFVTLVEWLCIVFGLTLTIFVTAKILMEVKLSQLSNIKIQVFKK